MGLSGDDFGPQSVDSRGSHTRPCIRGVTQQIGRWWRPNALFRFTRKSPGQLMFEPGPGGRLIEILPGGKSLEIGRITAWEPGVRLAFSWRQETFAAEQVTRVEVRFEPVGGETRVKVENFGWDTVPPEHVVRHHFPDAVFLHRHAEWWQSLLSSCNSLWMTGNDAAAVS